MPENKVTFGLDQAHIALLTETAGTPSWATPVPLIGAVSLGQSPAGSSNTFYADNMPFYFSSSNNGYTLTFVASTIPPSLAVPMFGMVLDSNGMLVEYSDAEAKEFALLLETRGNTTNIRIVYYKCKAERPSTDYETNTDTITPKTQSITIAAMPILVGTGATKRPAVRGVLYQDAASGTTYDQFFTTVQQPSLT